MFKYYVIRLGCGGLNQYDDNDDTFRGDGRDVGTKAPTDKTPTSQNAY